MVDIDRDKIKKVLLVNFKQAGDVLLATPTIRAFAEAFPAASISVAVYEYATPLLEHHPLIDEVLILDPQCKDLPPLLRLRKELSFLQGIRKRRFDIVVSLTTGDRGTILAFLSGAGIRIGQVSPKRKGLFGKRNLLTHPYLIDNPHSHMVERNLESIRCLGFLPESKKVDFYFSEQDRQRVGELLGKGGRDPGKKLVHIHPTSHWSFKCWKDEYMARVIDHLITEKAVDVALTSGPHRTEIDRADKILAQLKGKAIDLSGKTTLGELAALSSQADLFFGIDGIPMHVAAAVGTPVVALFGPSAIDPWRPWGEGHTVIAKDMYCRPCCQDGCAGTKRSRCLDELEPEVVIEQIDAKLDKRGPQPEGINIVLVP